MIQLKLQGISKDQTSKLVPVIIVLIFVVSIKNIYS